jgi:eukaryotic-like serine/threonine-protein kinase
VLGRGGMAAVYLARDLELQRPVAIKVLADDLGGDGSFRQRFVREARLTARLSHPNVVQVFDVGEAERRPYIVMEYVPGETLADVLARRRTLAPAEAVALLTQAAEGLQHAHEHGLVHRDVKPQNLLVRPDGVVKLADLGIARAAESTRLTQHGTLLGTAAYLSPEQAAGEDVSAAADVYSLGAVLYELLTGRPPHQFSSLADLAAKQASSDVVPPRDVDPAIPSRLETVVMRCLARDPRYRPPSAAELAAELRASLEAATQPATAATAVMPRRTHLSLPGRGAWLWIGAAAAAAVLAVVVGLAQVGGGSDSGAKPPPRPVVQTIPRGATPAEEARNLSAWVRQHSRARP